MVLARAVMYQVTQSSSVTLVCMLGSLGNLRVRAILCPSDRGSKWGRLRSRSPWWARLRKCELFITDLHFITAIGIKPLGYLRSSFLTDRYLHV